MGGGRLREVIAHGGSTVLYEYDLSNIKIYQKND